jgi:2-hydroxy-6-oxonona-2,4-dienedioate hydrolase
MQNPKFVTLGGVRTRYFEAGTGEDLVLIHGGKFGTFYSAYHWSLNFDELSKHFHVYAFDKLGMGDTDNPKSDADYTMVAVIEHARAFVQTLGIKNATLAGHSRGALPAARIAVDHPELVKALIIFDSSTLPPRILRCATTSTQIWRLVHRRYPIESSFSESRSPTPIQQIISPTISLRRC